MTTNKILSQAKSIHKTLIPHLPNSFHSLPKKQGNSGCCYILTWGTYNLKDLITMQERKLPKTAWVHIDNNNFKQSTFNIIMRDYLEILKNF